MNPVIKSEDGISANLEFRAMRTLNKLQGAQQELQQHYEDYGRIDYPCHAGLQKRRENLKVRIERCMNVLEKYITRNRSGENYG